MSKKIPTFRNESDLDRYAKKRLGKSKEQIRIAKQRFAELYSAGESDFWTAYGNRNIKNPQQAYINLLSKIK